MSNNGDDSAPSETGELERGEQAEEPLDEGDAESSRIPVAEEIQELSTNGNPNSDDRTNRQDSSDVDEQLDPFESEQYADREGDPFDDLFQEIDTEAIDKEQVWEQLTTEQGSAATERRGDTAFDNIATDELEETVTVPKSSFCQSCEYFEEPPEVQCTHSGTKIIEFVGMENVRVHNCPVVQQEREIGRSLGDDGTE
jgi:hypothetical protein